MEFNQFNLYSMNAGINTVSRTDEVDVCMNDLMKINEYDEVKDYLTSKFGNIEGEKWLNYDDLHKDVYILVEDDKIEFCALKGEKQYFGKGWKLIDKK